MEDEKEYPYPVRQRSTGRSNGGGNRNNAALLRNPSGKPCRRAASAIIHPQWTLGCASRSECRTGHRRNRLHRRGGVTRVRCAIFGWITSAGRDPSAASAIFVQEVSCQLSQF